MCTNSDRSHAHPCSLVLLVSLHRLVHLFHLFPLYVQAGLVTGTWMLLRGGFIFLGRSTQEQRASE